MCGIRLIVFFCTFWVVWAVLMTTNSRIPWLLTLAAIAFMLWVRKAIDVCNPWRMIRARSTRRDVSAANRHDLLALGPTSGAIRLSRHVLRKLDGCARPYSPPMSGLFRFRPRLRQVGFQSEAQRFGRPG